MVVIFFGMCIQARAETTQIVSVPLNKKHIAALFWSNKVEYKACLTMELICYSLNLQYFHLPS